MDQVIKNKCIVYHLNNPFVFKTRFLTVNSDACLVKV